MRKPLDQVNPVGRVDVLVFRLVQGFLAPQIPQQWEHLAPTVEGLCRKYLGPNGRLFK